VSTKPSSSLDQCLESAAGAHGDRPIGIVDEAVKLNQIQVIGAPELERLSLVLKNAPLTALDKASCTTHSFPPRAARAVGRSVMPSNQ